eukprot:5313971-Prymnesium_polylepis.1
MPETTEATGGTAGGGGGEYGDGGGDCGSGGHRVGGGGRGGRGGDVGGLSRSSRKMPTTLVSYGAKAMLSATTAAPENIELRVITFYTPTAWASNGAKMTWLLTAAASSNFPLPARLPVETVSNVPAATS